MVVTTLYIRHILHQSPKNNFDIENNSNYDSYGNGHFRNPALVKLDGSIIEPNTKLSELDIVTLNKMYPCENSCDQKNDQGKTN